VKGDVESIDEQTGAVNIEVKDSNHPGIWSVEGVARALRGFLGISPPRSLRVSGQSSLKVIVDKKLKPIRPFIACAVVRGVHPSEEALKSWINLQEKMDQTYGRKRRKASIGLYQADLIRSPLHYTVRDPEATTFVPLGSSEGMSLQRILEEHPRGQEYGSIISSFDNWPLLVDGKSQVLSLPPIINSNDLGRITTSTRNILVEVTGTSLETVHNTLKIMVLALAERGGRIFSCMQTYGYKPTRTVTPDLGGRPANVSLDYMNRVLGTSLDPSDAVRYLKRAGYGARLAKRGEIAVQVPPYRLDIMHPVDLVEDVAIALDLNNLKPEWPKVWTPGGLSAETEAEDTVAEVMLGLGYQEVLTYSLTSPDVLARKMNAEPGRWAELANPRMTTHTVLRDWLLPSLLEFLSANTHVDYPQRIFEVGPCERLDGGNGGNIETVSRLAAATIHSSAGFTEIRASMDALLKSLGLESTVQPETHPSFLEGRCGSVMVNERRTGVLGEINPRVVAAWGLSLPAAAFELEMGGLTA
jgi:phenylalanyl-tRNA synthetase beta chain